MSIKYQPLGIPVSSSFSISSSIALDVKNEPVTASFAVSSSFPVGPTGSIFKRLTGTTIPVVP